MKHRLKGLVALTLSLIMVFALATNAWGAVRIGGVELNQDNGYSVKGTNDQGTATYDATANTLTLNNFVYEGSSGIQITDSDFNIVLADGTTNSVTATSGTAITSSGSVRIGGTGTLSVEGETNGIYAEYTAAIGDSANVTVTGTTGDGIVSNASTSGDGVKINSDGNVTITGTAHGINSAGVVEINRSKDGTVEANATNSGGTAIYASDNVIINGGTVNATGGAYGIQSENGSISITGSTVTATGGTTGINAPNTGCSVTITDSTVTATGSGDDGRGIAAYRVTIEDATVTAAGSATDDGNGGVTYGGAYGIYSPRGAFSGGEVVIRNSTVTAKAGDTGTGIYVDGSVSKTIIQNSTVDIGCEVGIRSSSVSILADSTVTIESTGKAVSSNVLNFANATDPALSDPDWYQWSTNGITFTNSTTTPLKIATAAATATLYIQPATTGGGGGTTNPYPPSIYYPTPTPEPTEVVSAKTFDGGIGLYVAMSLLSVTGGAYLAKKKD